MFLDVCITWYWALLTDLRVGTTVNFHIQHNWHIQIVEGQFLNPEEAPDDVTRKIMSHPVSTA